MTLSARSTAAALAALTALGLVAAPTPAVAGVDVEVSLTGVVTDGSGQGWPLLADVVVTDPAGAAVTTTSTDPWTGRYRVTVPAGQAHTVRVTSGYAGYRETAEQVPAGTRVADVAVPVDTDTCVAPGYRHRSDGLVESFDSTGTPAGWSIGDAVGDGHVWRFDDPAERTNKTGGHGSFAVADAAYYLDPDRIDTTLVSAPADLRAVAAPEIGFASDFTGFGFGRAGIGELDLSVDSGASWENVWRNTAHAPGPVRVTVPIPQAAGKSGVRVRFRYLNGPITPGKWWGVDDVYIGNRSCDALPGGLVVGTVRDRNTGDPLAGASVRGEGGAATSAEDGLYWLFSARTGNRSFTAGDLRYTTTTTPAQVAPNQATRLDFDLAAGRIEAAVDAVRGDPALGERDNARLVVRNTGTAPATVTVAERPGAFEPLSAARRVAPTLVHGEFSPYRLTGDASPAPSATAGGGGAWQAQGDMPYQVADNAAAAHDGVIYTVAGRSGSRDAIQDAYALDTRTGVWSRIANLPHGRERPVAGVAGGRLYVAGGWGTGFPLDMVEQLDVYDPATGAWSAGADMPKPVAAAGSAVLDDTLYVVGGCLGESQCGTSTVQRYRPATNTWDTVADYPEALAWVSCGAIEARLYCTGGTVDRRPSRSTYSYDPGLDRWTRHADLPADSWAAATTVANGRLLLSGGVTNGTSTITNQGHAYSPATDTWSPLPNSVNSIFRGAGACGFYKVGGGASGLGGTPFVELLPGNSSCTSDRDADWLSAAPRAVTLRPGERVALTVRFDARTTDQPGTFPADLLLRTDTPYPTVEIPATMTVAPPANWGLLTGTVTALSCAGATNPLPGATVTVTGRSDATALTTTATGGYARWLPSGQYSLIAAADGHIPATADVRLRPGQPTVTDLPLTRFDC